MHCNTAGTISSLTGFDVLISNITLIRDTQAYIGNGTGTATVNSGVTRSGLVEVRAQNTNGSEGGVSGDIHSNLVGVHSNTITKDDALAFADTATLNVTAFEATAGNSTDYSADAKVTSNTVTGATSAYVTDSTVAAAPAADEGVILAATDTSSYSARSGDFQVDLDDFGGGFALGKASAINELNPPAQAYIDSSDVDVTGGDVSLTAINNAQISAVAEAVAVIEGVLPSPPAPSVLAAPSQPTKSTATSRPTLPTAILMSPASARTFCWLPPTPRRSMPGPRRARK